MSYGIDSDLFGFSDTTKGISLQDVMNPVRTASEATASDSCGDIAATTLYDTTSGQQITLNYKCAKDTVIDFYDTTTSVDFRLGKVINGYVITSIAASTSNSDFATVTLSGQKTATADGEVNKYTPTVTFNGGKCARKFGYSADTVTRLTGGKYTASVDVARAMDSTGEEYQIEVSKGREEGDHEVVGVTGAPGGAADTGWTLKDGTSKSEGNTKYADGSAKVFKNLTKDA
jgi:hypothetical protein